MAFCRLLCVPARNNRRCFSISVALAASAKPDGGLTNSTTNVASFIDRVSKRFEYQNDPEFVGEMLYSLADTDEQKQLVMEELIRRYNVRKSEVKEAMSDQRRNVLLFCSGCTLAMLGCVFPLPPPLHGGIIGAWVAGGALVNLGFQRFPLVSSKAKFDIARQTLDSFMTKLPPNAKVAGLDMSSCEANKEIN